MAIKVKVPENYAFPDDYDNGEPYSAMVTCRYDKDNGHIKIEKLDGHELEAHEPVEDGSQTQNEGSYADTVANAMSGQGAYNKA